MKLRKFVAPAVFVCILVSPPLSRAGLSEPGVTRWKGGRIEIARLGIDAEIHEGDDAATLRVSVGHIPGTAVPGDHGNVALAAHRYSYFHGLRNVRCGDQVDVITPDGDFRYEVDSIRVVEISRVDVLDPTPDPVLTLVTCFPFDYVGDAPQRLIVRAHRVESAPPPSRTIAAADPAPAANASRN